MKLPGLGTASYRVQPVAKNPPETWRVKVIYVVAPTVVSETEGITEVKL